MQSNSWKYFFFLKITFPKNIYFQKNILHWTKHSLNVQIDHENYASPQIPRKNVTE